jgi:hypothetical protein
MAANGGEWWRIGGDGRTWVLQCTIDMQLMAILIVTKLRLGVMSSRTLSSTLLILVENLLSANLLLYSPKLLQ